MSDRDGKKTKADHIETKINTNQYPSELTILQLATQPLFPAQLLPLLLGEAWHFDALEEAINQADGLIGIVACRPKGNPEDPEKGCYAIGTLVRVHTFPRDNGRPQYMAEGLQRLEIVEWLPVADPVRARVVYPEGMASGDPAKILGQRQDLLELMQRLLHVHPQFTNEVCHFLNGVERGDVSRLCDFAASMTSASLEEKQKVLEMHDLRLRLQRVRAMMRREVNRHERVIQPPAEKMDAPSVQLHYLNLKRELRKVEQQLGIMSPGKQADVERFESAIARLALPPEALERAREQLTRLETLDTANPEYAVSRNYLDCLTRLPWNERTQDCLDMNRARRMLEASHGGLDDIKRRILEFLAVATLRKEVAGSIILLAGPPGVGKTSIGRAIAKVLKRKFYRLSLGGMRDEAEIKGHRRTYVGAQPGRFIQAMREVGSSNPVIMLDEIDKMVSSYQGDPASALLEVLDPEQNQEFLDHYLDVRFDLSRVLFICTANDIDEIPGPLLDRMEIIRLAGYVTDEKVEIARQHLWPRLIERTGLKKSDVQVTNAAIRHLVEGYARETGVRNVEKQLGRLVRKAAIDIVSGAAKPIRINVDQLEEYLGPPVFVPEEPQLAIGVVTGLAWTSMGGTLLPIEATRVHTLNRGFNLTGNVGNVMYESAEIAHSYICAHLDKWHADGRFFDEAYVHLHVPDGAVPKDGPSAGITMACALLSLARQQKPRLAAAMTGELSLTGQVLAVGGIREKILAARRALFTQIIMPEPNRREYDKLPASLRDGLTVHFVRHFSEVAELMFDLKRPVVQRLRA